MVRLLFDPAPTDGGAPAPAPVVAPPPASAPKVETSPAPTPDPVKPPKIELSFDEAQRLYGRDRQLSDFEAEKQREIAQKEQERLIALAQKEGAEAALRAQKEASDAEKQALTASYHNSAKLYELATATATTAWASPEAARQARELMAAKLEVRQADGELKVVEKATGRPASEAVKGWLDSAEFKHFQAATTKGGSGADNSAIIVRGDKPVPQATASDILLDLVRTERADTSASNPYNPTYARAPSPARN